MMGWKRFKLLENGGSSSGSDHFPLESLSDMVNSFIQRGDNTEREGEEELDIELENSSGGETDTDNERIEALKKMFGNDDDQELVKMKNDIEIGFADQFTDSSPKDSAFKRRFMVFLRQRGYDAGLCKSQWEKSDRYPAGSYEYVDILTTANRYIIEPFPAALFEIARPTDRYTSLLTEFPAMFIGKPQTLKQIVRVMSAAMKSSLKGSGLQVAPWRRNGYLQAQWLGPYKRTINSNPSGGAVVGFGGFSAAGNWKVEECFLKDCRRDLSRKSSGIGVGLLAAALQGK